MVSTNEIMLLCAPPTARHKCAVRACAWLLLLLQLLQLLLHAPICCTGASAVLPSTTAAPELEEELDHGTARDLRA
jgi:hypothetical protein